jgi:peptidoglycan hydrolase CwlO-like protein
MEKFLKKLRELPENKKKIILWVIVVFLGIILFVFFVRNATQKINKLQGNYFSSGLKTPDLQQDSQNVGNGIKQIQDILNQVKNQNNDQTQTQNENEAQKETIK